MWLRSSEKETKARYELMQFSRVQGRNSSSHSHQSFSRPLPSRPESKLWVSVLTLGGRVLKAVTLKSWESCAYLRARHVLRPGCAPSPGGAASVTSSVSQFSRSVVSDSLRPRELQHARPPCPSPSPGVHSNSSPSSQ